MLVRFRAPLHAYLCQQSLAEGCRQWCQTWHRYCVDDVRLAMAAAAESVAEHPDKLHHQYYGRKAESTCSYMLRAPFLTATTVLKYGVVGGIGSLTAGHAARATPPRPKAPELWRHLNTPPEAGLR